MIDIWNRIDEIIPEKSGLYLVYFPYQDMLLIDYWDNKRNGFSCNVTHWMDLPQKPKNYVDVGLRMGYLTSL